MSDTQIITRKVRLIPVGEREEVNRVYRYIRDGMYAQNKAYNILISNVYAVIYSGEPIENINMLYKRGQRKPKEQEPEYSLYPYDVGVKRRYISPLTFHIVP